LQKQDVNKAGFSYAWVILIVLFIGQAAAFGTRASFGAYISPWEQDFSISRTIASSISMLSFVVYAFGQPLVGKLNDFFGKGIVPSAAVFIVGISMLLTSQARQVWQLFILYSVGFSLGIAGTCSTLPAVIITEWFTKKRGFALGLTSSGLAVGQLIMVPATLFIIERLGWRTAMATMSIIIMVVVGPLFIFLLRSKPEEKGLKPYGYEESAGETEPEESSGSDSGKPLPLKGIFKLKVFWLLSFAYFICGFTDVGMIGTHLIPMSQGKGIPVSIVAIAISLIATANIAGSIITGHLSDHFNRKRQLAVIYSIRAASLLILVMLQSPWLLLLFAVAFGAVEMASIAPTTSLIVEFFKKYSVGTVLGVIGVSHQLGGAVGAWAPGMFFDQTNSYTAIMVFSILALLAAAVMSLLLPEASRSTRL